MSDFLAQTLAGLITLAGVGAISMAAAVGAVIGLKAGQMLAGPLRISTVNITVTSPTGAGECITRSPLPHPGDAL